MIKSISKIQNVKSNNISYKKKQSNIAFQGNFSNVGKHIIEAKTSKVNSLFQKLIKPTELQVSKKPLIAATSMDPLDHMTAEQIAQLASQSKGSLEKLRDLVFGPKTPKTSVDDVVTNTGNKPSSEISSNAGNIEKSIDNTAINPNISKLEDSILDTSVESANNVKPEDIVWDQNGEVAYIIDPKIEAELKANKLEQLAQELPKEAVERNIDPKDIIFDQDGNIVHIIDHTEPIISSHPVIDHNPDSEDIDIDLSDIYMGV